MLMLAGAFGLIVLAAVLFMAYLQWRAVTRVMESSLLQMQNFSLGNGRAAPSLVTGAAQANARLFSAVDLLQKRILELEDGSRHALTGKISSASGNGIVNPNDRDKTVANLLAEGQTFLNSGEAEKALDCFDGALKLEPKHAEALVRKGSALEKLARLDEAIAYYDLAIEADASMTKAYLQKGGLFNGMARYDEALQCYEQALRAKEKKPAA
ncbi:MAG: tetratricopeptide repeat protein [Limisphaerales bacterium]